KTSTRPPPPAPYHCRFKVSDVGKYLYKIRDDSVRPRNFLGADDEDGIEAILSDREGHSLHEYIDGDEPLRPIIDFDLPREVYDSINPKLTGKEILDSLNRAFMKASHEIFPEWDHKTITIASSSDAKKISYHISTFGMRLQNIAQVAAFTELVHEKLPVSLQEKSIIDNIANKSSFSLRMLGSSKYVEETKEHIRVKKAIHPKNGSIFDFMLRPPNDESKIIKSPILDKPKTEVKRCNDANGEITQADYDFVELLLRDNCVEGYTLSFPSENTPNLFSLTRNSPSHCPICDREHTNENAYIIRYKKSYRFYCYRADQDRKPEIRNPSLKLTISETALDQEQKLPSPTKLDRSRISDPNDHFVWGDLIDMCGTKEKFTRNAVYEAIQATIACIQTDTKLWVLKLEDSNGSLFFKMSSKLDIAKYEISLVELGGEAVKLVNLIDRAVIEAPIIEIDSALIEPIIWHIENVWCNRNNVLSEYVLNWFSYLVQYPDKKPGTVLVLRSPPRSGKNILTDFIGKEVLGQELFFASSDLGKVLGRFNSCIQARKLILLNETGMASGEWHKANDHLKSLITEPYVTIECKGLEPKTIKDFAGYIVLSNHDAPLRIEMGDGHIVCLDVSPRCKGNMEYFKRLGKILDNPNTPGVFMNYLLKRDLSDWIPQNIPNTKMRADTMRDQLPNPIRFIINYISLWSVERIDKLNCTELYQEYLGWCGSNGEKPFSSAILGKKFSQIGIDRARSRDNGVRVYQYILDHSKIIAKLHESGLGNIEEFSDIPQDELPANETTDIPIFNMPEKLPSKFASPQLEKNTPPPLLSSKGKKADNWDNSTKDLFDYVVEQAEPPVVSTSGTSEESKSLETIISSDKEVPSESVTDELEPKPDPEPRPNSFPSDPVMKGPQWIKEGEKSARAQREERLRKRAIELGENPDDFMTITKKDKLDSITFRDRMEADARMCGYAKEVEEDPNEYMDMKIRERLMGEEIIRRDLEDDGVTTSWLDTDEE
ncbi:16032_t:CDS:2, partial [Cetraspora pellucida]